MLSEERKQQLLSIPIPIAIEVVEEIEEVQLVSRFHDHLPIDSTTALRRRQGLRNLYGKRK